MTELGEIALSVAEVQLLMLEPNVRGVKIALKNVKLVAKVEVFDVIGEEEVCSQVVGLVIEEDDKLNWAYGSA